MTDTEQRLPPKCRYCDCRSFTDYPYNGGSFVGRHFACGLAVLPHSERQPFRWHEWKGENTVRWAHLDYLADQTQRRLELIMEAHGALCVTVPDDCPSAGDVCWEHCYAGAARDNLLREMRPDLTDDDIASLSAAANGAT